MLQRSITACRPLKRASTLGAGRQGAPGASRSRPACSSRVAGLVPRQQWPVVRPAGRRSLQPARFQPEDQAAGQVEDNYITLPMDYTEVSPRPARCPQQQLHAATRMHASLLLPEAPQPPGRSPRRAQGRRPPPAAAPVVARRAAAARPHRPHILPVLRHHGRVRRPGRGHARGRLHSPAAGGPAGAAGAREGCSHLRGGARAGGAARVCAAAPAARSPGAAHPGGQAEGGGGGRGWTQRRQSACHGAITTRFEGTATPPRRSPRGRSLAAQLHQLPLGRPVTTPSASRHACRRSSATTSSWSWRPRCWRTGRFASRTSGTSCWPWPAPAAARQRRCLQGSRQAPPAHPAHGYHTPLSIVSHMHCTRIPCRSRSRRAA